VGDTTARNGSAAGLTTGQSTIDPTRSFSGVFSFLGTYIQDNIGLIAKDINGNVVPFISSNINSANTPPIESIAGSLSGAVATADTNDLEGQFSDEFSIFGVQPDRRLLVQDVPEFLKVANEQTDRTFAAVYLYFAAPTGQSPDKVLRSTDALSINNPLDAATMVVVTAATGEIPTPVSLPVNRQIIDRWVEQLRGDVKQPDVEDLRNRYMQNARNLYNKLMRPIVEALPDGVDNLIFVLGDGLRQIPLASLYDEEKGQFLVEQYGITLVPAFSYLDDADQDLPVSLKNAPVFAMGTSTFPPESELDPLPGVPTELDLIAETRQATILKDEEFTVDNLLDRRDTSPIVHLATHANFGNTRDPDSDNPTRSASTPASFIQFSDRQLPIREVNTLDLNRPIVELFTLSACETAVGDRDAELGFAGLSIQAGAESALASLWKVGDAGTPVFMGEFYQQLNQQVNRTEALRQAQIAMIRGRVKLVDNQITLSDGTTLPITDESFQTALRSGGSSTLTGSVDLTHPFYWAAFTLIGSPW
jgi:CHAT domain-containing protein